jgi:hypothetical protein
MVDFQIPQIQKTRDKLSTKRICTHFTLNWHSFCGWSFFMFSHAHTHTHKINSFNFSPSVKHFCWKNISINLLYFCFFQIFLSRAVCTHLLLLNCYATMRIALCESFSCFVTQSPSLIHSPFSHLCICVYVCVSSFFRISAISLTRIFWEHVCGMSWCPFGLFQFTFEGIWPDSGEEKMTLMSTTWMLFATNVRKYVL